MKGSLFIGAIALFAILSFSSHAISQTSNIEIREGHVSEDILRILHSFDDRIKKLEDTEGISRNIIVNPPTRDSGDFIVAVSGASKDNDHIHISVGLHNKTSEPILLALSGNPTLIEQSTGKTKCFISSQPILPVGQGDNRVNDYTSVPGADNCTLNFTFSSNGTQEDAFNLDLSFWTLKNGQATKLPIVPLRFVIK